MRAKTNAFHGGILTHQLLRRGCRHNPVNQNPPAPHQRARLRLNSVARVISALSATETFTLYP